MLFSEFENKINEIIINDNSPIVAHISCWPIFLKLKKNDIDTAKKILNSLKRLASGRGLLMPTFSTGYKNGLCDLDNEKSSTGIISELFRVEKNSTRTLSAFFSYSTQGQIAEEIKDIMAHEAWGEGSVYDWMEKKDTTFLLIGTSPTHISYIHRFEWLFRDKINYRYRKEFTGTIIRKGKRYNMKEQLFVRNLSPEAIMDFSPLEKIILASKMKKSESQIPIYSIKCSDLRNSLVPIFNSNPTILLKNKKDFQCQ